MNDRTIIELCVLGLIVLGIILYFGIKLAKNKYVKQIYDKLVIVMQEAEEKYKDEPKETKSIKKQQYVLEVIKSECRDMNIPYDFIAKLLVKTIKTIIDGFNAMTK